MFIHKKINELKKQRDFLLLMIARLEALTATPSTENSIIEFEYDVRKYDDKIDALQAQVERGVNYV